MAFILTVLVVFLVLVTNEMWWRKSRKPHGELSRKMVHLVVGTFVAFWPFFLTWGQIELLSVAFLVVVAASKYLNFFQAIHAAQRPTWGEIFFAAAVGIIALLTHDKWVYAAALLQMGLADGLAAVIGVRYGTKATKYLVLGHTKSVIGTLTFFVVSLSILLAFNHFGHEGFSLAFMLTVSGLATAIENFGVYGSDNLLVPLLVAGALANF